MRLGSFLNIPENIMEHMARDVSAGMPTNHGNQYFCISFLPIISQGCTKMAAPIYNQPKEWASTTFVDAVVDTIVDAHLGGKTTSPFCT